MSFQLFASSTVIALAYAAIAAFVAWLMWNRQDVPALTQRVLWAFVLYPLLCGVGRGIHAWGYWQSMYGTPGGQDWEAVADWLCATVTSATAIGLWLLREPISRMPTMETWRLALAGSEARCEALERELAHWRRIRKSTESPT